MSGNSTSTSREVFARMEWLLTQGTNPTAEEMKAAHEAAKETVRKINERLNSVHQLIVAGRRTEAIEVAETAPSLIEELSFWDTSLIRDWNYWAAQFKLPPLAALRTDQATSLRGAYGAEKQLEPLLRRHRLLAIGRANLGQRISVLSQLAAADRGNPQWNRALAEFQRRRLEQLAQRAAAGIKLEDLVCLQQVADELKQTRWLSSAAKMQLDALQRQIQRIRARQANIEAIALADHISDAFSTDDHDRLLPLIQHWKKLEPMIDQTTVGQQIDDIQPALDWFQQQVESLPKQQPTPERQPTVEPVVSAYDDEDLVEAEVVAEVVSATPPPNPPPPPESSEPSRPARSREAYAHRAAQETRSRQWQAGLITAAFVAVVLGGALWMRGTYKSYQQEATLTKMLGTIDRKLTKGQLAEADELLSSAPNDDERFNEVRNRLQEQQAAEARRAAEYAADVAELRESIKLATQFDAFEKLSRQINELSDRAGNGGEKEMADELKRELSTSRDQRKMVVMDQARQLIVQIRDGLATLEANDQARNVLTQWNLQLLKQRTDRFVKEETALIAELETTSEAVADRREAIRASNRVE